MTPYDYLVIRMYKKSFSSVLTQTFRADVQHHLWRWSAHLFTLHATCCNMECNASFCYSVMGPKYHPTPLSLFSLPPFRLAIKCNFQSTESWSHLVFSVGSEHIWHKSWLLNIVHSWTNLVWLNKIALENWLHGMQVYAIVHRFPLRLTPVKGPPNLCNRFYVGTGFLLHKFGGPLTGVNLNGNQCTRV